MEGQAKQEINLTIDVNSLEGTFANMFQVSTLGGESRLDCVFIDRMSATEQGPMAKVVARVNMTTDALAELRRLLDRHFDETLAGEAVGDGE